MKIMIVGKSNTDLEMRLYMYIDNVLGLHMCACVCVYVCVRGQSIIIIIHKYRDSDLLIPLPFNVAATLVFLQCQCCCCRCLHRLRVSQSNFNHLSSTIHLGGVTVKVCTTRTKYCDYFIFSVVFYYAIIIW